MSSLENPKALRRLDLCKSGIIELPQGIDTLTKLRYLNLECPTKLIPDGILCKLSHLQYLVLSGNCEISIFRVEEIASLRRLETLSACFRDLNDFNACVNLWKDGGPTDYSLTVGNVFSYRVDHDYFEIGNYASVSRGGKHLLMIPNHIKSLRIKNIGNVDVTTSFCDQRAFDLRKLVIPDGIKFGIEPEYFKFGNIVILSRGGKHLLMLPNHIKSLRIENIENLDAIRSFCDQRAFDLRKLFIFKCGGIKHLLPSSGLSVAAFQSLESLYLRDLHDLSDLVEVERSASSALHTATFSYLRNINIESCRNINRLFTSALLYNLQNLERLFVFCCDEMVEIIGPCDEPDAQEASSSTSSTLPNLSYLGLYRLPELKFFCSNIKMDFPSLKDIFIFECPKLKRFPPLPPFLPSKEVAASTSTISLEGINRDR